MTPTGVISNIPTASIPCFTMAPLKYGPAPAETAEAFV